MDFDTIPHEVRAVSYKWRVTDHFFPIPLRNLMLITRVSHLGNICTMKSTKAKKSRFNLSFIDCLSFKEEMKKMLTWQMKHYSKVYCICSCIF